MKRIMVLLFIIPLYADCQLQDTINPLKGDIRVHDPVMIKQGNTYYIFHTSKGVSAKMSKDRINWKHAGSVFPASKLPAWHKNDIAAQDGNLCASLLNIKPLYIDKDGWPHRATDW